MQTFTGKQLILNEVAILCTDKKGIGMVSLLSRFDHFHFLDGVKYVNQLQEEKRIVLTDGVIYPEKKAI